MGSDTGTLYVGDIADPASTGKLMVVTNAIGADSTPFMIKTADTSSPLVMSIQTITKLGERLFKLSTKGETAAPPSNFSLMPDGGNLNIGSDIFTASNEKVEVNGNVRASGFKIPGGTASQFLMADGSTSTNSTPNAWSFAGNAVTETDFIGTTNSSDIIFKGNNKERWRMGTETGTFYVGDVIDPASSGTLMVVTNTVDRNNTPFIIRTSDETNPLTMAIITDRGAGQPFFRLTTKGELAPSAANLSLMSDGGVLNIGGDSFSGQQEKVEVTGYVKATGFKVGSGGPVEYLMSDGTTSRTFAAWELTGNALTDPATNFIGTTDSNPLVFKTNNSQRLHVASDGGVFVNEDPIPGYQFHVNGTVGGTQTWAVASDKRLKTNIQPVENGLSSVMQMKPVTYDKKASLDSKDYNISEIGFIAQDLKSLFPKAIVNEGQDKDKLLSVNYTELIPVLTKAIQDQQKIIDEEKAKNDKQQKEIDELKAMLKQLMEKK